MTNRFSLFVTILLIASTQPIAEAGSITFDFSGTGIGAVSGSITVDGNPTSISGWSGAGAETWSDVSIVLNWEGQTTTLVNSPQDPYMSASFTLTNLPQWDEDPPGVPSYEIQVLGGISSVNSSPGFGFGMTFYSPGQVQQISNLSHLSFLLDTSTIYMTAGSGGPDQWGEGGVSSIGIASVPEPSTLTLGVFAVAGVATILSRYRRES